MNAELFIQPLNADHDRTSFSSGNSALDLYLQRQAKQDVNRDICRVYILAKIDSPKEILGFYTLSSHSIIGSDLPEVIGRKLPRHPIPTVLLGRLAVSHTSQGRGLGSYLIHSAIEHTQEVSEAIGIYALIVDAIDVSAISFYQHFGFTLMDDYESRLFLPLSSI